MPKIRGIKPEFWTDEDVVELSVPARLLFIGLWNFACDNGHLPDKPKQIKMRILPADDVDVNKLLDELAHHGRISRADGTITIAKFAHHQKPHKRWWVTCETPGCNLPEGASHGPVNRGTTVAQPLNNGRPTDDVDGDVDGDGELTPTVSGPRKRGQRLTDDWRPSTETRDHLAAEFPQVDQTAEFWKFQNYWMAKSGKDATKIDWDRTYSNWIRNSAERQPTRPRSTQNTTDDLFGRAAQRLGITQ